jgi:RecB family exonuclease
VTEPTSEVDSFIAGLTQGVAAEAAAAALASLANRAAARLHALARAQASAHKDQPAWPAWAQLQNASRAAVLHTSTCRDLAARLPPAEGSEPQP